MLEPLERESDIQEVGQRAAIGVVDPEYARVGVNKEERPADAMLKPELELPRTMQASCGVAKSPARSLRLLPPRIIWQVE